MRTIISTLKSVLDNLYSYTKVRDLFDNLRIGTIEIRSKDNIDIFILIAESLMVFMSHLFIILG